ncbi:MAG: peptide chain release factor N(5)-glutamine methyltransferase [Bdellovibrio sp.]|nr:peptide chain release factor N(5)-glutamine methyltransferase [Bdellovibrio sp.]
MKVRDCLVELQQSIPQNEAELLLIHILNQGQENLRLSRFHLLSESNREISNSDVQAVRNLALKRSQGIPLQHLTGVQFFGEHEYKVSSAVLIPRPETEILLREVLEAFEERSKPMRGLEVGLGSGILSIELLSHFPGLNMLATEVSENAIRVARENAEVILGKGYPASLDIIRVLDPNEVLEGVLSSAVPQFDFILSNPPYLKKSSQEVEKQVLDYEPSGALFPENGNPSHFYEKLACDSRRLLGPEGRLFLEVPHERSEEIVSFFQLKGWKTELRPDLSGRPRVLICR